MKEHIENIYIDHAGARRDLHVEIRNVRMVQHGREVCLQDVVTVSHILDMFNVQCVVSFNANLCSPLVAVFDGEDLLDEMCGVSKGIEMFKALGALAKRYEVTTYFLNHPEVWVVKPDMSYTTFTKGIVL